MPRKFASVPIISQKCFHLIPDTLPSQPGNTLLPSRIRSHPSREMLLSRPGCALIPARKYSSPIPERFRPTKINFANIGKIPDSISLIDKETALRSANIRITLSPKSPKTT